MKLTALKGVDGSTSVSDHIIRTENTGELCRARLIGGDVTRQTEPRRSAVVRAWTTSS